MPGNWAAAELPNLKDQNHTITSPQSNIYNCIAWAVGETNRWWWPFPLRGVSYWPNGIRREITVKAFVLALATRGFRRCADGSLEAGVEKVALFAKQVGTRLVPTHAARQLENGQWTSKLGPNEDISHIAVEAVNGPLYGQVIQYLSRPKKPHLA